ncbi:MAG: AAA family ATPase [Dehalococcoidia bacterium]
MLNLSNIQEVKNRLDTNNVRHFDNVGNSFRYFLTDIEVVQFRHLTNLPIPFDHPITVITGPNKIGKTSVLLLIACSYENFLKMDSTSADAGVRQHMWRDVLEFTKYETTTSDYSYKLAWRVGTDERHGEGKRLASSKAWSGLGKKSADSSRINAKIKGRHVRLIDLERVLPLRNFSTRLLRKTEVAAKTRLNSDIETAFGYIFDSTGVELYQIGSHVNKLCYLIKYPSQNQSYSSYNAASGEEAVITILKDMLEAPVDSLILIDEIEAGFHPSVQRKLADVIHCISWRDKKQFIITSHSPTLISAFNQKSRKFIDIKNDGSLEVINKISKQAAFSKMDTQAYPLVTLYCEDEEAEFLIKSVIISLSAGHKHFDRLINVIKSGPANEVKNDYERHKRNFNQMSSRIGFCCVFDGDYRTDPAYSSYYQNPSEFSAFIYPYKAPEKFLVEAFLQNHPNQQLNSALTFIDHHSLFEKMVQLSLAQDVTDAKSQCFSSFRNQPEYMRFEADLEAFLINTVHHFSSLAD